MKKQKYKLNTKNDVDMMEIIKKHQDHLAHLNIGIDDN